MRELWAAKGRIRQVVYNKASWFGVCWHSLVRFCKLGSFWKAGDLVFETMRCVQSPLDQLLRGLILGHICLKRLTFKDLGIQIACSAHLGVISTVFCFVSECHLCFPNCSFGFLKPLFSAPTAPSSRLPAKSLFFFSHLFQFCVAKVILLKSHMCSTNRPTFKQPPSVVCSFKSFQHLIYLIIALEDLYWSCVWQMFFAPTNDSAQQMTEYGA